MNEYKLSGLYRNWASLSKIDFDGLWHQEKDTVMRVQTRGSIGRTYFMSRSNAPRQFSPFHGIRSVPEWGRCGSNYQITQSKQQYNAQANTVQHDGGCMLHWDNNEARCDGQSPPLRYSMAGLVHEGVSLCVVPVLADPVANADDGIRYFPPCLRSPLSYRPDVHRFAPRDHR